jgi:uncharacterized membrane protein
MKTMQASSISDKKIKDNDIVRGSEIREEIFNLIKSEFPDFTGESIISINELDSYRRRYLARLVEEEKGDLAFIDDDVMKAFRDNTVLSENIEPEINAKLTIGQKLADKIAKFGGSWTFIVVFFSFLLIWMAINIWVLTKKPFDPYPFILLNLILSCLAAIQAPIIMMSQNRQEQKDRQRAEHDYKINLKAELEIKLIGEKIDHLIAHQNKKLLEIQEIQVDYLEDLLKRMENKRKE